MENNIFEKEIKFQCQGSANCCVSRGSYGFVFLSKKDLLKLCLHFKCSLSEFKKKYCQTTNSYLHLKEINKNGDCIFLKNKKCNIYKARPTQCRTWPFWPENMKTKIWNKEIMNFCPGIGKGKTISKRKIEKLLISEERNSKKIFRE